MTRVVARFSGFLVPFSLLCAPYASAKNPGFEPRECAPVAASAGARCGVIHVPEDPSRAHGRKIGLSVLVLPATGAPLDAKRAQYDLEGGPGFAATDFVEFYAGEGAVYRRHRDIVLVDMRGTGGSNPLRCAGIEESEKRQPTSLMYPAELVAECAQQSSVASDPTQYTTAAAARDIEWVRRALGYEQLDLNAISYGTTLALRYIADFPARVHSAVLMGTVPPDRTPPRFHAIAAQAALEKLAADCDADADCRKKFGDVRANLRAALGHAGSSAALPAPVFMEKLRNRLYSPAGRARVPGLLARSAQGDFNEFLGDRVNQRTFADGLYLAITCSESFAVMDVPAAITASRATSFGAYRLERQAEACRHWPVAARASRKPARTAQAVNIPVLFIAGELDPVSPADWAQETASRFPGSALVRVARGAHVLDGLSDLDTCLDAVILRFLDSGTTTGLDTSCFARMKAPPFEGAP
jgi:pimeloyl-ACP methyl ester carboxylesterase